MLENLKLNYREYFGGKYAISFYGYLALAIMVSTMSVLSTADVLNFGQTFAITISNLASLVVCAIIYILFRFTAFRNSSAGKSITKPYWLFVMATLMAMSKVLVVEYVNALQMVQLTNSLGWPRLLVSFIICNLGAAANALIATSAFKFAEERELIITEILQDSDGINSTNAITGNSKSAKQIREFLEQTKNKLQKLALGAHLDLEKVSSDLTKIARDDARKLSHEIWKAESGNIPDYSLRDLSRVAMTKYRYPLIPIAALFYFVAFAMDARHLGFSEGVFASGIALVIFSIVYVIANLIKPKNFAQGWLKFSVAPIVVVAIHQTIINSVLGHPFDQHTLLYGVLEVLWIATCVYSFTLVTAIFRNHEELIERYRDLVLNSKVPLEYSAVRTRLLNRSMAQYLHGDVQNQLLAAAMKIEESKDENASVSEEEVKQQLSSLEKFLDNTEARFDLNQNIKLTQALHDIEKQWSTVASVKIQISAEELSTVIAKVNSRRQYDIATVINEAVTNAIRHGMATVVRVTLHISGDDLWIQASDNGLGPRTGKSGLGKQLYTAITSNRWSLKQNYIGGSSLVMQIALAGGGVELRV